jgi:hypothetical protein
MVFVGRRLSVVKRRGPPRHPTGGAPGAPGVPPGCQRRRERHPLARYDGELVGDETAASTTLGAAKISRGGWR